MKTLTGKKLIIVYISLIMILAICIFNFVFLPNRAKVRENNASKDMLESQIGDMSPLDGKIDELTEINKGLVENIEKITAQNSEVTMTREEFLVFLGEYMDTYSVDMVNFSDLGTEEENGIYKSTYDIQMRGTLNSLNEILRIINSSGISYSVGSVSLREDKAEEYLKRYFDEFTKLEWYSKETPQPTSEVVVDPTAEPVDIMPTPEIVYVEPEYELPMVIPTPETQPTYPVEEPDIQEEGESITERLDKLLEQTSYKNPYEIKLRTNENGTLNLEEFDSYQKYEKMLLNITIQFIMYQNPEESDNSILNYINKTGTEGVANAVLQL